MSDRSKPEPVDQGRAGTAYAALIADQLQEQRARKASLEQRGMSVITTSGTLVTLLFALVALIAADRRFELLTLSRWLFLASLVGFIAAASFAILVNHPVDYSEPSTDELRGLIDPDEWSASSGFGERRAAESRMRTIAVARCRNETKVKQLKYAMRAELLAVASLATAVAVMLVNY